MPGRLVPYLRSRIARLHPFDLAAMLLIAALLVVALVTFRDYAISNDEQVQHRYGELILAYHASGFTDQTVFHFKNLYLYGGLFDIVVVLLGRIVPIDVYVIRHLLCALIGLGGIVATWATARLIAGPRAGALAALALAVCGPWFGSMFNHTKDIPFAAAMMGATYFLLRAARDLPHARWRDILAFGLLLGAALGLRAIGLLLVFYALIAIVLRIPRPMAAANAAHFLARSLLRFFPAFILAYAIMVAAWPWAAVDLLNPIRAVFAFSHFHYPIKTLLSGQLYLMADVPRWYVPAYLAIKLPLIVLLGAALAVLVAAGVARSSADARFPNRAREIAFIAFTALFPVLCQVIGHGPAFSGMRHFIFVVPPLAVLAGIGFDAAFIWLAARQRVLAMAAVGVLAAWLLWTASVLVRLHPYEYLFFNPIVGGLQGAARAYDTDYWVNVMHEAVVELEKFLDRENRGPRRYYVAVCGERLPFEKEAAARDRLRWATDDDPADFFIAPTHQDCDTAIDGKVILRIERMGVPIGVVKDRRYLTEPRS